jgi:hypothetical protein
LTSTRSRERLNLTGEATVSFFNELDTGKRTMLRVPGSIPRLLFHFLTSLPQRRKTMLVTSVSFFNELAIEKRNCARDLCFIFLTRLLQRRETMLEASVSFFNALGIERRNCARGLSLIMASKRITLWKDTMSRGKT